MVSGRLQAIYRKWHPWNADVCETEEVICAPDWPGLEARLAPVLAG